jgi:hypothetical protein
LLMLIGTNNFTNSKAEAMLAPCNRNSYDSHSASLAPHG